MSRFSCASTSLSLNVLLRRMRRAIWTGLGLSVVLHFFVTTWTGVAEEERIAKPLTTQFIKRQPRLTKPLELKKRPRPKRRQIQREMVSVKARADRRDVSAVMLPVTLVGSLARPQVTVRRAAGFQDIGMEPATLAQAVSGTMKPKEAVDMSLELMDLDALDTGRYHAMVIEDPNDKKNLTGFFHLAPVYSPNVKGHLAGSGALSGTAVSAPLAVRSVVKAINRYTDLRADVIEAIPYNSEEIMKIPCLLIYLRPLRELQESESENLGRYLMSGGFAWCEDDNLPEMCNVPFLRAVIKKALASQGRVFGRHWEFKPLPNSHPLYHCYFDFDGPLAKTYRLAEGYVAHPEGTEAVTALEGAEVDGRLMVILDLNHYINIWGYWGYSAEMNFGVLDRTRYFQFAVNLIVFALTQEGSVTHRVMQDVR